MKRFKSARQARRFLSVHDEAANFFRHPANASAAGRRLARTRAFQLWTEIPGSASSL
jgi:putative transposase